MKYFINFFVYKFTVAKKLINQLAADSVLSVIGTIQYIDCTLHYWYKDLVEFLTGKIVREHINEPAGFL